MSFNPNIIKARIVDDLLTQIEIALPNEGHRNDPEFLRLCERIQGQVVELRFRWGDAFEVIDNNYWLPKSCWKEHAELEIKLREKGRGRMAGDIIDAANSRAALYEGDDRQDIKTDVINAFYAGAEFGAKKAHSANNRP